MLLSALWRAWNRCLDLRLFFKSNLSLCEDERVFLINLYPMFQTLLLYCVLGIRTYVFAEPGVTDWGYLSCSSCYVKSTVSCLKMAKKEKNTDNSTQKIFLVGIIANNCSCVLFWLSDIFEWAVCICVGSLIQRSCDLISSVFQSDACLFCVVRHFHSFISLLSSRFEHHSAFSCSSIWTAEHFSVCLSPHWAEPCDLLTSCWSFHKQPMH